MFGGEWNVGAMENLKTLLKSKEDSDSDDDDGRVCNPYAKLTPGDVGLPKQTSTATSPGEGQDVKSSSTLPADSIWSEEEVNAVPVYDESLDPRPAPEYDIYFRQAVTTEDIFLGMSNKTPGTASCEDMVVKITLPDTEAQDINLDVKQTFLDLRTPKWRLGLHLPNPVDKDTGKAQWDKDRGVLTVILRNRRDLDFMNF